VSGDDVDNDVSFDAVPAPGTGSEPHAPITNESGIKPRTVNALPKHGGWRRGRKIERKLGAEIMMASGA
jgi:hypothetical protein